jgi:hypothetical protein
MKSRAEEIVNKYTQVHIDGQSIEEAGAEKMLQALKKRSNKKYTKEDEEALLKKFRQNIKRRKAQQTEAFTLSDTGDVKNVKNKKDAIKALKELGIKWKKEEEEEDGAVYFLVGKKDVAVYYDQFNLLHVF